MIHVAEKSYAVYVIAARLTPPLTAKLGGLRFQRASGEAAGAGFAYQLMGWKEPELFIVVRRPLPDEPTWQLSLSQKRGLTYFRTGSRASACPIDLVPHDPASPLSSGAPDDGAFGPLLTSNTGGLRPLMRRQN